MRLEGGDGEWKMGSKEHYRQGKGDGTKIGERVIQEVVHLR
jgi:hypothetical protein